MSRIRIMSAAVSAVLIATVFSSCRTRKAFDSPFIDTPVAVATTGITSAEIERELSGRTEHLDQLWVKMGVTVRENGKRAAPSFTLVTMYREPDELLFGISRREIGTVYTARVVGEDVVFYANRERDAFRGTTAELAEKTDFFGGIMPRDLIVAITVQRNLYEMLASDAPVRSTAKGDKLLIATPLSESADGATIVRAVRAADLLVRESVVVDSRSGETAMRIRYGAYELIENPATGTSFAYPTRFTVEIPSEQIEVECSVKEYRLAPDLKPFPDPGARAKNNYPLSSLQFESDE